MIRLAWKNLTEEPIRLAISAGGVALSVVLILVMRGIFTGSEEHAVAYIRNQPASIWVMQDGVENMHMATSMLSSQVLASAEQLSGENRAVGVLYANVGVDLGDKTVFSYVFGVEPGAPFGGPWSVVEGNPPERPQEIVIDQVLARRNGLSVGDEVQILNRRFEISGLSEDNFGIATSLVFLTKADLAAVLELPTSMNSYILVAPDPEVDQADLVKRLDLIEGAHALAQAEFMESDKEMIRAMGVDVIRAMTSVAYSVGLLVIGLVLYSATVERQREYGMLRAIGGSNSHLWRVVLAQALFSALLGINIGVLLSYASAAGIGWLLPEMLVVIRPEDVLRVSATLLAVSSGAAVLPAIEVSRLDPLVVFRT